MSKHLFELVKTQLMNGFVSGGLVLMFTGSIVALARNLPGRVWGRIKSQFTVQVEIKSTDALFDWLSLWLHEQPYSKRTRRLSATTISQYGSDAPTPVSASSDDQPRPTLIFSPAPGEHFFVYGGKLIWLSRAGGSQPTSSSGSSLGNSRFLSIESYHLRVIGRSQKVIRELLDDAISKAMEFRTKKISAFLAIYGSWRRLSTFAPRPLASVILPEQTVDTVIADLKEFIDSQDWYIGMGIPYHRGYLFHGLPGTGKTSLIGALAGEMKMNLYVLNLANEELNDEGLAYLVSEIQPRSFLVLEDIDAAFVTRDRKSDDDDKKRGGLTLTGLLNSLDGFMAKDGSIVFMTTNHRDQLDPALIRPGRVDLEIEFVGATDGQLRQLHNRFFPSADSVEAFVTSMSGKTMAEAQQALIIKRKSRSIPLEA